jgi:hypothetical protein
LQRLHRVKTIAITSSSSLSFANLTSNFTNSISTTTIIITMLSKSIYQQEEGSSSSSSPSTAQSRSTETAMNTISLHELLFTATFANTNSSSGSSSSSSQPALLPSALPMDVMSSTRQLYRSSRPRDQRRALKSIIDSALSILDDECMDCEDEVDTIVHFGPRQ